MQGLVGAIINAFTGGFADKLLQYYVTAKTSDTQVNVEALRQAAEVAKLEVEKLRLDQGSLITRSIRPLFALPFIVYYGKIMFVDKVCGPVLMKYGWDPVWFVTPGLSTELVALSGTVVTFYFGGRTIEAVASRIWRR